ncbi:phage late control D family protein [Ruminiclostridium cellobioparum]|uniref:Phage protein D n=1 Tax=Ruminiclostridium cellobioparum subsp. termitidis CT1112 TaxID=1195236 RepID=S0FHG7_RUMCE|nr:contractile injection system protein, VgrG/Pvc8 family [Ruminiclostridium cellobioparum]EMS70852.1 Phage protein D [Ruminiclostridium cellobioparum subsp. termitidis CT1112]
MGSVANYKIKLNGTDFPGDLMNAVEAVTVEDEINLPAMFSIKLNMVDSNNGKWRGIDLKTFKPGDKIVVSMGLDRVETMVSGEITSLELNLCNHSILEIRGYDMLHRLRMGTRNKVFTKKKDSDIAGEIAKEHGLSPQVDDSKTVYPYVFQNNLSNYEFLLKRAAYLDYELYADDKKMYFVKSRAAKAPELPDFTYRKDFEELTLELKTLTRGSQVVVRGWDIKEKKEMEATAKKGDETTKMDGKESGFDVSSKAIEESPVAVWVENLIDLNEAQSAAKAAYNSLLKEFISGHGKCYGNPLVRAGKSVKILGIDERFSGSYYIVSTIHNIDKTGYMTTFKVKRTGI